MRAVVLEAPGSPVVTTVPDPSPRPGEVIVSVDACGICGTDQHIFDGEFAPTPYPIVPGHEFAGEVVALGQGVDHLEVGTVVAVDPTLPCHVCAACQGGRTNLCERWGAIGDTVDGAFAEYVAAPAANLYRLPTSVPRSWGPLVEPISCAVHAFDRLAWRPGSDVLIYGAGTWGWVRQQLLRHAGAGRVDVVDRNPDRLPRAAQLGADATAMSADEFDTARYDLVVDAAGAVGAIEDGLGRVARGGTLLVFGVTSADAVARFSPFSVYNDEISIVGSMAVLHSFGRARDLVAAGVFDGEALITARLAIDDYAAAIERFRAGTELKIQLVPKDGAPR
jgi:2-desacetyl-2-hydroxyethyl bacteriochlorophyllide A dehydrogenase